MWDIISSILTFAGDNLTEGGSITAAVIALAYALIQRYGKKEAVKEGIHFRNLSIDLSKLGKDASIKKAKEEGLFDD